MAQIGHKIPMKPLMTIGVKCYNQARYIREAVEAAFAQTYRPLEVVVSDDGSSDGSWEVIQEVSARHRNDTGIQIILNRNAVNLGNMGNWMVIGKLSHGDWIVKADGDDISEPARVERIAEALAQDGVGVEVVLHGAVKINPDGKEIGAFPTRYASSPLGAVMAFSRACFTAFPVPENERIVDDEVFARRALMLGREINLEGPLVRYRVGTGISSGLYNVREPELVCIRQLPLSLAQSRRDLDWRRPQMDEETYQSWRRRLDSDERETLLYTRLLSAPTFRERWRSWRAVRKPAISRPGYYKLMIYLLPRRIGDWILWLLGKARYR